MLEPIVTVSQLMVSTHPEWTSRNTVLWSACIPFDMGRYGDPQLKINTISRILLVLNVQTFILEPIVTVSQLMVSTHAEWTSRNTVLWLPRIPFDIGLYGYFN